MNNIFYLRRISDDAVFVANMMPKYNLNDYELLTEQEYNDYIAAMEEAEGEEVQNVTD